MGASQPDPEGRPIMNHRHRKVLHAIFGHPVSANIDPKAVEAVFEELGAEVTHNGSGRLAVKLNSQAHAFHNTQHSLSKDERLPALRAGRGRAGQKKEETHEASPS
jgi:hypothetical protein